MNWIPVGHYFFPVI
uniref:Uncharacterized protein n=1 Tax=Anguilla anguilla TaxID=7936 RepID=A0A0E9U2G6_ANGAN